MRKKLMIFLIAIIIITALIFYGFTLLSQEPSLKFHSLGKIRLVEFNFEGSNVFSGLPRPCMVHTDSGKYLVTENCFDLSGDCLYMLEERSFFGETEDYWSADCEEWGDSRE